MSVAAPEPKGNMGQPVPRYDARDKVTGGARYASDFPLNNAAYAFFVTSPIAKGRITGFDWTESKAVPGVLDIITHENADKLKEVQILDEGGHSSTKLQPLSSPEIKHEGQIVAVIVANTYEAAREANYRAKVSYQSETPTATFDSPGTKTEDGKDVSKRHSDPKVGDAEKAFQSADHFLDLAYETQTQHHNPIELFTTSCAWDGDRLTIWEPSQFVHGLKNGVAAELGIDAEKVRAISPYVGGAFGSKGSVTPRTALIAMAAKRVGRPVKLVMPRDQGFTVTTYRAETRHRVRLAAAKDGRLTALGHEGWEVTSRTDGYLVGGTHTTAKMYATPNVLTKVSVVRTDRNTPGFMRSPPETPYMFALETALDEMAVKIGMDPVEFRKRNDTRNESVKGNPYTSRSLIQCYDQAAQAFGWSKRKAQPGATTDGDWLVGYGCATACYPTQMAPSAARVKLSRDGSVRVEIAAHEIGNGAYTVIGQQAAEKLGVPFDKVEVRMGDSDLPPAPVAGGSVTTASACSAVIMACDQIREKLFKAVNGDKTTPLVQKLQETLGKGPSESKQAAQSPQPLPREQAFDRLGVNTVEEYAEWKPDGAPMDSFRAMHKGQVRMVGGGEMKDKIAYAFGAEFVEVRINKWTKEIRVPRITGAFAAGRIMNPRTARSQLMGGLIWGISAALHEETEIDTRVARYVNDNLADYLIPVNADIDQVEVILVPEEDKTNPAGVKGLGELGNVGTTAAISNAIFNATGVRLRKLPFRIENLLV